LYQAHSLHSQVTRGSGYAGPNDLDEDDYDTIMEEDEVLEGDFTVRAVAVGLIVG
jgi:hypothetical protein